MEQYSMFGGAKPFKIDKPIRLIELFGGISCQAQALMNLGIDFEEYRYCDFDKYACQSHNEIMGRNDKPSDITKWKGEDLGIYDTDKYCYIMFYSFPCTDLSTAGKMAGMAKGSGSRSGLLWEVERLLNELVGGGKCIPQCLIMENVPQVHGKKNKASFDEWCQFLESLGYKNYWKDLNAKDYGVPQSRNRCFMVSLLGDYSYEFPEPIELKLKLQDLLEDEVDEKYYISDKMVQYIAAKNEKWTGNNWNSSCINRECACTKTTREGQTRADSSDYICKDLPVNYKLNQVAQIVDKGFTEMTGRVYDSNGLSPTIQTMQGGNRQPKIQVVGAVGEKRSNGGTQYFMQDRIYEGDIANAICTCANPYYKLDGSFVGKKYKEFIKENRYIADKFNPYNKAEIKDIAPTQSTQCGSTTSSSAVLLKQEMCNKLIQDGKVKENDVIRHNYTTSKNGDCIQSNNESPTLDTRCDCLGVCVKTNNKRQKELANKIDLAKDNQFLDFYNQKAQENIAGTITTRVDASNATGIYKYLRIRKLTETECLRLMGVRDDYIKKMTCSRSQKYKQAGNGIVVDVLMAIFKQML